MSTKRIPIWLLAVALIPGVVLVFIGGLWAYMVGTATPLHPIPENVPSVTRSTPSPKWADAVEQGRQIVRTGLIEQNLPGLSVAVGVGSDIVWAEGFGWADLENRVPVGPDMGFRIGTASKALTSAAVGVLLEKNQLKLDEEIQKYVPEYPKKPWPVTLRQLMAQTAGVRTDAGDEEPYAEYCERTADGPRLFANQSLRFEPGTEYRDSSFSWILVSAAVDAAAREPFSRFMRRQIFEPLGMTATRLVDLRANAASAPGPDQVTSYFPRFAADPRYGPDLNRPIDLSCYSGSMALVSTPSDLGRFAMALNGAKLLQPATVQLLQTSQALPSGQQTGYGLGWDLETVTLSGEQTVVVGYDGVLMDGVVASFWTFPRQGIVVAVTSNISWSDTFSLAVKVAEAFSAPRALPSIQPASPRDR